MRHTISILMENESGALSRVVGLFSARGYNIESLCVAPTHEAHISRMTLVTRGSEKVIEQIIKQLNKLIEVVKLIDLTEGMHLEREMLLIKLRVDKENLRQEYKSLADIFRGNIIDVSDRTFTVEITGTCEKVNAFLNAVDTQNILEVVRTGVSGISRGSHSLHL